MLFIPFVHAITFAGIKAADINQVQLIFFFYSEVCMLDFFLIQKCVYETRHVRACPYLSLFFPYETKISLLIVSIKKSQGPYDLCFLRKWLKCCTTVYITLNKKSATPVNVLSVLLVMMFMHLQLHTRGIWYLSPNSKFLQYIWILLSIIALFTGTAIPIEPVYIQVPTSLADFRSISIYDLLIL